MDEKRAKFPHIPFFISVILVIGYANCKGQVKKENKLLVGRLELSNSNYKGAIQKFNQAIENDSLNYESYYYRGISKLELGDLLGAESDLSKSVSLNKKHIESLIVRGSIRDKLINYDGAFSDFKAAIEIDSTNPNIYINRSISYNALREFKMAIQDCNKALKLGSNKELVYIVRGIAKLGLKKYRGAIEDFNTILSSNKLNPTTYVRRATAYYHLSKYDSSLKDVNHAIYLDEENSYAYFQRAMIYIKIERKTRALEDLHTVLKYSPNSALAYYNRAMLYSDLEDFGKALSDYDKVILTSPKNVLALYNRALIYQRQKEVRKALGDVEKIIEIYPDFVDAFRLRSSLRKKLGNFSGAREDLQTAEIINNSKLNIADSLIKAEESYIDKVTSFGGQTLNKSIDPSSSEDVSLVQPYFLCSSTENSDRKVIDVWNEGNKSFTTYFLTTEKDKEIDQKTLNDKLNQINTKINRDRDNAELYLMRGIIYMSLQLYDKALLDFNKTLRLNPENYLAYFGKANIMYHNIEKDRDYSNKSLKLVINHYNKCIQLNPEYAFAYFNRAYLKFQNNDYIGSIEDYSIVIDKSKELTEAHLNRALILLTIENDEQACKDLSKAGELGMGKAYQLISRFCNE